MYFISFFTKKLSQVKQNPFYGKANFYNLTILLFFLCLTNSPLLSQDSLESAAISSESYINWENTTFFSDIRFDMSKAGIFLPTGRNTASYRIQQQLPFLVQSPLLTIPIDSSTRLGDAVLWNSVSLENLITIIANGYNTPSAFERDTEVLTTSHSISLGDIVALMVFHKNPYKLNAPIEQVSSRQYSGIIIDARGYLPVHGEFVEDRTAPALFPKIWDETMELLYEPNMIAPQILIESGAVIYSSSTDEKIYEDRVGLDPLRIVARQVFGIYRTDPVISRNDALKILSVPENIDLLTQGKVVLLLDGDMLSYQVVSPLKDKAYYFTYNKVEDFIFDSKIEDIAISNVPDGIRISITNLKFISNSDKLLVEETQRLDTLAKSLLIAIDGTTDRILIEGHTANIGRPEGEQTLSVERAQAIIGELVNRGVDESLFTYRGYGATMPIGDNATEEGRALNRRVEITVIPETSYIQKSN